MFDLNKSDEELEREVQIAEIAGRRQRSRARVFAYVAVTIVSVLLLVGSIWITYGAVEMYQAHARLRTGLKADGFLDNSYFSRKDRVGTVYSVTYHFSVNGQSYNNSGTITNAPVSPVLLWSMIRKIRLIIKSMAA